MVQERFKLDKDQPPSGGGRFRAIIDTVIGNLQLSITNVHIRFEVLLLTQFVVPMSAEHKPDRLQASLVVSLRGTCTHLKLLPELWAETCNVGHGRC